MPDIESVLQFSNRIRQLAAAPKPMNISIAKSEMVMALLNSLRENYNALISTLDAIDEDETKLKFVEDRSGWEVVRIGEFTFGLYF